MRKPFQHLHLERLRTMQNYFILLYLSFAETWTIQHSVSSSQGCQKGKSLIDGRLEIMLWLLSIARYNLCFAWAFSQSLLLPLPLQSVLFVCTEYELLAYKVQLASYLSCFLCASRCLGNSASASIIVGLYILCGFMPLSVFFVPATIVKANFHVVSLLLSL